MGGANLELFRFAFYLFFPVAALFHYGNPEWYNQHVLPVRTCFQFDARNLF
jgi:protein PET100